MVLNRDWFKKNSPLVFVLRFMFNTHKCNILSIPLWYFLPSNRRNFRSTVVFLLTSSEDYYGDLDLKSIRKSELLAGLQNNDQTRAIASKAAVAAKSNRPSAAKDA